MALSAEHSVRVFRISMHCSALVGNTINVIGSLLDILHLRQVLIKVREVFQFVGSFRGCFDPVIDIAVIELDKLMENR